MPLRYSSSNNTPLHSAKLTALEYPHHGHGWNDYYSIPQYAADADETYAEYDQGEGYCHQEVLERERQQKRDAKKEQGQRTQGAELVAEATTVALNVIGENGTYSHDSTRYNEPQVNEKQSMSGQVLRYGERHRGKDKWRGGTQKMYSSDATDFANYQKRRKQRCCACIGFAIFLLVLVIAIPTTVVFANKHSSNDAGNLSSSSGPSNTNLDNVSHSSIPQWARGSYLDPFDWYDTLDFNVTFTDAKVGGLYIMGLNSTWNDNTRANDNVPRLNEQWNYGTMPFRGVNLGGWLSIEPFITPSLFSSFDSSAGVVDEWTLSQHLGPTQAQRTIEKHYSQWVQESTFAEIQAAGFDHIRIPFSYWAVTTYQGDPYVAMISWRYLLRGIEWARKYGLRINLDLHGAPGSQNGWNHSGRQGPIGWLNGTDGALNAQRTIDMHKQLSTFFSQPRYKNIITMYGLVNEPRMTALPEEAVMSWSKNAITAIRNQGYGGLIVVGDGFLGLLNWQGQLQEVEGLVLDAHQYIIFDTGLIELNHYDKINYACGGWTVQTENSINPATGFGPTMFGEWSQADTDCAQFLNNVGVGSRWEGTLDMANTPGGATSGNVLTPTCPTHNDECSCTKANADPSSYSDQYVKWLLTFAEAQMFSFELGWGWMYWTWKTESAPQWSYKDGIAAGILPKVAYKRSWNCNMTIPAFSGSELLEYY